MKYNYGNKHHWWKGDNAGYTAIHAWLISEYGKSDKCENKNCPGVSTTFQWAKKKNCKYLRRRKNFIRLCRSCHAKYDMTDETRRKISVINKGHKMPEHTMEQLRKANNKRVYYFSAEHRLKLSISAKKRGYIRHKKYE